MDFSNRNSQAASPSPVPTSGRPAQRQHKLNDINGQKTWFRVAVIALVLAVVILLIGLIVFVSSNNNSTKSEESKYVYSNKLQAVFLNTGQVYFGNIKSLNNQFIVLSNIYYLQTNSSNGSSSSSSSSNSNVTLVKLGCELHMPYDQMVINNNQVTFWENLQDNGQVAKAVSTFQKQNPNGQKCADQSSSSGNTSSNVQNSSSNSNSNSNTSNSSGH